MRPFFNRKSVQKLDVEPIVHEPGWRNPVSERQGYVPYRTLEDLKSRYGYEDLVSHWKLVCNDDGAADLVCSVAERVFAFVGLLPLHPSQYSVTGGALLALTRASRQAGNLAQPLVWGDPMSSEQRAAAPFWRATGIIISFIPWISLAVSSTVVADQGGRKWDPTVGPLSDWLESVGEARLFWGKSTTSAPSFDDSRPAVPWLLPHLLDEDVRIALHAAAGNPLYTLGEVLLRMPVSTGLGHNLQTIHERSVKYAMDIAKRGDRDDLGSQPMALSPVCVAALRAAAQANLAVLVDGGAGLLWPQSLDLLREHLDAKGLSYHGEFEVLSLLQDLGLINSMDPVQTDRGSLVLLSDPLIAFPLSQIDGGTREGQGRGPELNEPSEDVEAEEPPEGEGGAEDSADPIEPTNDPMIDELLAGAFNRLTNDIRKDYSHRKGAVNGEKGSAPEVWVPASALENYGVPVKQFQGWLLQNEWIIPEEGDPTKARIPHTVDGKKQPCLCFSASKLRDFYKQASANTESSDG